jgi:hypothetical protein
LLPGGHSRWRGDGAAAAAVGTTFFPLPLGRPGPRFSGALSPSRARDAPAVATVAGVAVATTAMVARVFCLWLPFGCPSFQDAGGVTTGVLVFFLLPFGRPGPRLSETPPALVVEPTREDMAGQCSEGKDEVEQEVKCTLNPKCPLDLRRSGRGGEGVGSMAPDILVTAPHRAHLQERNRCGRLIRLWGKPTGRVADVSLTSPHDVIRNHYGDRRVQATRHGTAALRWPQRGVRTRSGTSSEGLHAG